MEAKEEEKVTDGDSIVTKYEDDYVVTKKDFVEGGPLKCGDYTIPLDRNNIILVGQSQSGKTCLLLSLMVKYFLHVIEPK
jgi:ATP-dependent protease Clp ATPase subunit